MIRISLHIFLFELPESSLDLQEVINISSKVFFPNITFFSFCFIFRNSATIFSFQRFGLLWKFICFFISKLWKLLYRQLIARISTFCFYRLHSQSRPNHYPTISMSVGLADLRVWWSLAGLFSCGQCVATTEALMFCSLCMGVMRCRCAEEWSLWSENGARAHQCSLLTSSKIMMVSHDCKSCDMVIMGYTILPFRKGRIFQVVAFHILEGQLAGMDGLSALWPVLYVDHQAMEIFQTTNQRNKLMVADEKGVTANRSMISCECKVWRNILLFGHSLTSYYHFNEHHFMACISLLIGLIMTGWRTKERKNIYHYPDDASAALHDLTAIWWYG